MLLAEQVVIQAEIGTILAVASILLTAASVLLRSKKGPPITEDDGPSNYAARGAFLPLILGQYRIGPHFVWIQPGPPAQLVDFGASQTGKGGFLGKSSSGPNFYEDAIHALCVGPVDQLIAITQNGKTIFKGPITRTSHPSGTQIDLGSEGWFKIWWGDADQPINATLAAATNNGISSRWPFACYVEWHKFLGPVRAWSSLKYELLRMPVSCTLTGSSAAIPADLSDTKPVWPDPPPPEQGAGVRIQLPIIAGSGGPESLTSKYVKVSNRSFASSPPLGEDLTVYFRPGTVVALHGPGTDYLGTVQLSSYAGASGRAFFYVVSSSYDPTEVINTTISGNPVAWKGITTVRLGFFSYLPVLNPLPPAVDRFRIDPVGVGTVVGVNYAHALFDVMFAPYPFGAQRRVDRFDINSLEELGRRLGPYPGEGLICNLLIADGETADSVISRILQDIHYSFRKDIETGKYVFEPVRKPSGDLPTLPSDILLPQLPQRDTKHGRTVTNFAVFSIKDSSRNFRDFTLPEVDDGSISETGARPKKIEITSCTDITTGQNIAKRRAQETFANPTKIKISAQREARLLGPGQAIRVDGIDVPLRIVGVTRKVLTGEVELVCLVDFYGVQLYGSEGGSELLTDGDHGGLPAPIAFPSPDDMVDVFELPRYLTDGVMKIIVPRVRSSPNVTSARIYLSRLGDTYDSNVEVSSRPMGGFLTAALPDTSKDLLLEDDGTLPTFQVAGVDASYESLAGSEESWLLGRQVMLIGQELCYVRNLLSMGGGLYKAQGLVRARLGTAKASHAQGTRVYVFLAHEMEQLSSVILQPGKSLSVKTQPFSQAGGVLLSLCEPVQVTLRGDALRPLTPCGLRTANMGSYWVAGADVVLKWNHRSTASPKTGAGMQGAGAACGVSAIEGLMRVQLWTIAGPTKVAEWTQPSCGATITNADLISFFVGEPSSFRVTVCNVSGGFASDEVSLVLTKV